MTWPEALDRFEAVLEVQEARLAAGDFDEFPVFEPPGDELGPLPDELRARAEALLSRSHDVELAVADRLVATGRQLTVAGRFRDDQRTSRPPATYVDRGL